MTKIWQRIKCAVCGEPFEDEDDWYSRHDDEDGADIHDRCCTICKP